MKKMKLSLASIMLPRICYTKNKQIVTQMLSAQELFVLPGKSPCPSPAFGRETVWRDKKRGQFTIRALRYFTTSTPSMPRLQSSTVCSCVISSPMTATGMAGGQDTAADALTRPAAREAGTDSRGASMASRGVRTRSEARGAFRAGRGHRGQFRSGPLRHACTPPRLCPV